MKRHRRHFCFGFFAMARVRQHPSCTLLVSVEENAVRALAVPPCRIPKMPQRISAMALANAIHADLALPRP